MTRSKTTGHVPTAAQNTTTHSSGVPPATEEAAGATAVPVAGGAEVPKKQESGNLGGNRFGRGHVLNSDQAVG